MQKRLLKKGLLLHIITIWVFVICAFAQQNQFGASKLNTLKDFDGDGKADISVYRPSTGFWFIYKSGSNSYSYIKFGIAEDIPVVEDYDGDGKADIAVYRPSTGVWYILESQANEVKIYHWGLSNDIPVAGDYNGDGLSDLAVFRPSDGFWYIFNPVDSSRQYIKWGLADDLLMPGDFFTDGVTVPAVFRPTKEADLSFIFPNVINDSWFAINSESSIPLTGDFFGDGTADRILYDRSSGNWGIKPPEFINGTFLVLNFGGQDDYPVANDYDGDGRMDVAVYNRINGIWTIRQSTTDKDVTFKFGLPGDIPVQLPVGFTSF